MIIRKLPTMNIGTCSCLKLEMKLPFPRNSIGAKPKIEKKKTNPDKAESHCGKLVHRNI